MSTHFDAIAALLDASARSATLHEQLRALVTDATPVHIYALGISTVAPSPHIAKAMQAAASSAVALDGVVVEAAAITDSLSSLSLQAEAAVRRVRELDTLRARIQSVRWALIFAAITNGAIHRALSDAVYYTPLSRATTPSPYTVAGARGGHH